MNNDQYMTLKVGIYLLAVSVFGLILFSDYRNREARELKERVAALEGKQENPIGYIKDLEVVYRRINTLEQVLNHYEKYNTACKEFGLGRPVIDYESGTYGCQDENSFVFFNSREVEKMKSDKARADAICRERKKNAK